MFQSSFQSVLFFTVPLMLMFIHDMSSHLGRFTVKNCSQLHGGWTGPSCVLCSDCKGKNTQHLWNIEITLLFCRMYNLMEKINWYSYWHAQQMWLEKNLKCTYISDTVLDNTDFLFFIFFIPFILCLLTSLCACRLVNLLLSVFICLFDPWQVKERWLLVSARPSQTRCVAARMDTTWPQWVIARNMNHWVIMHWVIMQLYLKIIHF